MLRQYIDMNNIDLSRNDKWRNQAQTTNYIPRNPKQASRIDKQHPLYPPESVFREEYTGRGWTQLLTTVIQMLDADLIAALESMTISLTVAVRHMRVTEFLTVIHIRTAMIVIVLVRAFDAVVKSPA